MATELNIFKQLRDVQRELKAPKNQTGRFGKSRSAEAIIEAAKPVLHRHDLTLLVSDEITQIGERHYVKATAAIFNNDGKSLNATANAWEGDINRGLDASQVTGMASSYARKYALGGLFAIDDSKDADAIDDSKDAPKAQAKPSEPSKYITEAQVKLLLARSRDLSGFTNRQDIIDWFIDQIGVKPTEVYKSDMDEVLDTIQTAEVSV